MLPVTQSCGSRGGNRKEKLRTFFITSVFSFSYIYFILLFPPLSFFFLIFCIEERLQYAIRRKTLSGMKISKIKAPSRKSHADLANNTFRITRSLDIYCILMVKTISLVVSLAVLLLHTVIISSMFLLFLGHHQGDNRYKKWIKHLYTG